MSICSFLPLEKDSVTYTYLYGGVKVRCRVLARLLSVSVLIFDGHLNRFRTRRFTPNTFAGVDKFTSLLESIKFEDPSMQSFAIATLLSRIAIETLSANELLELYNTYSPLPKAIVEITFMKLVVRLINTDIIKKTVMPKTLAKVVELFEGIDDRNESSDMVVRAV